MFAKHSHKKGMTLIEIIVAMTIFAIIVVAIFPALMVLNRQNTLSQENLESTFYTQQVAEKINAQSLVEEADEDSLKAYLVSESFLIVSEDVYEKTIADAPYKMTVRLFDVDASDKLLRVMVESEATTMASGHESKDRSSVEMVVRFP